MDHLLHRRQGLKFRLSRLLAIPAGAVLKRLPSKQQAKVIEPVLRDGVLSEIPQQRRTQLITAMLEQLPPKQRAKAIAPILQNPEVAVAAEKDILGLAGPVLQGLEPMMRGRMVDTALSKPVTVETPHGPIRFLTQSRRSCARAESILTKEPDSLKWVDAIEPGSVFWDIGANIGVLSLYAAARRDLDVWAFEPAAVNYYNLTANCELNGFSREVHCLLLGFSDSNELAELNVSQLSSADSFSFTKKRKGKHIEEGQTAQLWTIDDFIEHYGTPCPNYIKIDVPGLTRKILVGGRRTLSRPEVKQVQVEANERKGGGRWVVEFLSAVGFSIVNRNMKRHGTVQGDLVFAKT